MIGIIVLLLGLPYAAAVCSISDEKVTARIELRGDALEVDLRNSKMQEGEWTAIAFGPNMTNLELYVFDVDGGKVRGHTGVSTGYASPPLDADGQVLLADSSYSNGEFSVRFSLPMNEAGPRKHSLGKCEMITLSIGPMMEEAVGPHYVLPKQIHVCFDDCK